MKQCRLIVAVLLMALCICTAAAADEPLKYTSGDFVYVLLEDGTAEITAYTGKAAELDVPETLDGYRVTSIGASAFCWCSGIKSLALPEGLTTIGDAAFSWCHGLTSITIPDSVTCVGANPFMYCSKLTNIRVSPDHVQLAVIDGVLFDETEQKLICYPCAFRETSYAVPDGTRSIGSHAFHGSRLKSIALPDTLICLEDFAFEESDSLTSITLPDSLVKVGVHPFNNCYKLKRIEVSQNHPVLAVVEDVLFDQTDKRLICTTVGFVDASYVVPDGVCIIGDYAFAGRDHLQSITMPDSVVVIGDYAFQSCDKLASVVLPAGVTSVGAYAFNYCRALKDMRLPDSLVHIGDAAFDNASGQLCFTVVQGSYADEWCRSFKQNYIYCND